MDEVLSLHCWLCNPAVPKNTICSGEHQPGHYAFKVSPQAFEEVIQKLRDWNIDYWAGPRMQRKSGYYELEGKRGLYFIDPSGHGMEVLCEN